jgi:hypothetical protein
MSGEELQCCFRHNIAFRGHCPACAGAAPASPAVRPDEPWNWEVGSAGGEFTVSNGWRTFRTALLGDAERLRDWLVARAQTTNGRQEDV